MTWTEQKPKNLRSKEVEPQKEHIIDKRPYIEPKRICPLITKKKKSI